MPDPAPGPPTASGRHPVITWLIRGFQAILIVGIVGLIGQQIVDQWDEVKSTILAIHPLALAVAIGAVAVGMFCGVRAWQHLLMAMGIRVPYVRSAQINLVGSLGKYLPGSVWSFVLQAQLGLRYGVTRSRSLVALLLQTGLSILAGMILSLAALPTFLSMWGPTAWLLALSLLGLVVLHPRLLTWITNTALRLLRRGHLDRPLPGRQVALAFLWSMLTWVFFGIHLWVLVNSLGDPGLGGFAIVLGAMALAMSAGFVAFILPSGIGAREFVLVAGLATLLPRGAALAIVLCSRLLFTIADVVAAAVASVTAKAALDAEGNDAHRVSHF